MPDTRVRPDTQTLGESTPVALPQGSPADSDAPAVTATRNGPRPLILHCHCYKNAGSTFDTGVVQSLGPDTLVEMDRHPAWRDRKPYNAALIREIAAAHPEALCLSSHQTVPTLEADGSLRLLPIAFVRHPLLRVASVYRFEMKQQGAAAPGAEAFGDWLARVMDDPASAECKNYQAALFSLRDDGKPNLDPSMPNRGVHWQPLVDMLDRFAVVGVVEEFDLSMARIRQVIAPHFPGFAIRSAVNRTKEIADWRVEAARLETEVPAPVLDVFRAKNAQDYGLFMRYLARLKAS
jgi:hypothetical protein